MKPSSLSRLSIAIGVVVGTMLLVDLFAITPAEASGCRPTGRRIAGKAVLTCSGRTKCRPTGRTQIHNGKRYAILRCPG